jgi:uncharacterized protein (DUF58 family)
VRPTAATLLLAAGFVLAAAAFGSPSLYVPGVALALLVTGLCAWVRSAARRVGMEPVPGPWSLTEGDSYALGVRIGGNQLLPGSSLEHPLADRPLPTGTRPAGVHRIPLRLERRGRRLLDPPALLVSDPFGLQSRRVKSGEGTSVLVLPRIEAVAVRSGPGTGADQLFGAAAHGSGGAGLDARGVDFEIDGVRPFREGTPASRIHWPTVARSGELVERRLISGGDSPPLVVLDASDPASDEALDRAVRAAASICAHLAKDYGCLLLLPGEPKPLRIHSRLRGWREAHAKLALVEACRRPPPAPALRAAETVFVVSASLAPSLPTLRASARLCLLTPEPIAGMRTLFTVAGCSGQAPGHGHGVAMEAA